MTARTSHKTVTFTRSFFLSGIGEVQPAGSYRVETDEEEIPGLSFSAYRRLATMMILPACPGTGVGEQIATIDPLELEAAQQRDAEPTAPVTAPSISAQSSSLRHPRSRSGK